MPDTTKINTADGSTHTISASYADTRERIQRIQNDPSGRWLEIDTDDGRRAAINPAAICVIQGEGK